MQSGGPWGLDMESKTQVIPWANEGFRWAMDAGDKEELQKMDLEWAPIWKATSKEFDEKNRCKKAISRNYQKKNRDRRLHNEIDQINWHQNVSITPEATEKETPKTEVASVEAVPAVEKKKEETKSENISKKK